MSTAAQRGCSILCIMELQSASIAAHPCTAGKRPTAAEAHVCQGQHARQQACALAWALPPPRRRRASSVQHWLCSRACLWQGVVSMDAAAAAAQPAEERSRRHAPSIHPAAPRQQRCRSVQRLAARQRGWAGQDGLMLHGLVSVRHLLHGQAPAARLGCLPADCADTCLRARARAWLQECKKVLEEKFKSGKNRWFFTKLRF